MNLSRLILGVGVMSGISVFSTAAFAQNSPASVTATGQTNIQLGVGTPPAALPPSRSDNDMQPRVAAPVVPAGGVVQQAGVGGTTAYGRPGVLEFGGSLGLTLAGDLRQVTIAPSIGWFFADNLQLSGIVAFNYASTSINGQRSSAASLNVLVEPSYHLPLSNTLFLFGGLGVGVAYADGPGAGFALAPRLGMNLMVGRSGILTPALTFVYSTSSVIQTPQGTLVAGNTSLGFNAGYTVMW